MEGQYPEGISKDGDLIRVDSSHKSIYQLLGRVSVELKQGSFTSPFPLGPKNAIYVSRKDLSGLHKYCKAVNFQGPVWLIGLYIPAYIVPWNIPCYFQSDFSGEEDEDIEYRKNTLKDLLKAKAAQLGGNLVVGFETGGISVVSANSGGVLANKNAWSAIGYIVKTKQK